jgi:hypothetical protein
MIWIRNERDFEDFEGWRGLIFGLRKSTPSNLLKTGRMASLRAKRSNLFSKNKFFGQ